jgi:catechol 2,3-dioxygenase
VSIPKTNPNAPFNVTRASHAVLTVKDIGASRAFYVDAIGLVVSDETKDALYLRGVEEAAHHSLVLKRTDSEPVANASACALTEDDLEKAKAEFDKPTSGEMGRGAASGPHSARQRCGRPLELCATMET